MSMPLRVGETVYDLGDFNDRSTVQGAQPKAAERNAARRMI